MHEHTEHTDHNHQEGLANAHKPLVIIGTDADARIALDIANSLEIIVYGFMNDKDEEGMQEMNDVGIVMRVDSPEGKKFLDTEKMDVLIAERDIAKRKDLERKIKSRKVEVVSLVARDATISPYSSIGKGNLVGAGCKIMPNSHIGSYNSLQADVFIDTDTTVDSFCTLQSGVKIGRSVKIADEVFMGAGAIIFANVEIGKGAFIGPGAVVLQNVPKGARMMGNPAKEM